MKSNLFKNIVIQVIMMSSSDYLVQRASRGQNVRSQKEHCKNVAVGVIFLPLVFFSTSFQLITLHVKGRK